MKRPDPMAIECQAAGEDPLDPPDSPYRDMAIEWRAYAMHLEERIATMELAGRFRPGEFVWYSSVRAKGRRPAIVRGVKGRRVRVSVPGPGGKPRETAVAPASLRVCHDMGEWQDLAVAMGLITERVVRL